MIHHATLHKLLDYPILSFICKMNTIYYIHTLHVIHVHMHNICIYISQAKRLVNGHCSHHIYE